jgi:hypothetical protein
VHSTGQRCVVRGEGPYWNVVVEEGEGEEGEGGEEEEGEEEEEEEALRQTN